MSDTKDKQEILGFDRTDPRAVWMAADEVRSLAPGATFELDPDRTAFPERSRTPSRARTAQPSGRCVSSPEGLQVGQNRGQGAKASAQALGIAAEIVAGCTGLEG
jgi:hypothetical protein